MKLPPLKPDPQLRHLHHRTRQQLKNFKTMLGRDHAQKLSSIDNLLLTSSDDTGVVLNGGRRGSQWGPRAIIAQLEKMVAPQTWKETEQPRQESEAEKRWAVAEVGSPVHSELKAFGDRQLFSQEQINRQLEQYWPKPIIHLGGGHDHIYPLMMAFKNLGLSLAVINIDAHCDTRADAVDHSGTPFRQFSTNHCSQFHLYQLGIQSFANDASTLSPLPYGEMTVIDLPLILEKTDYFRKGIISLLEEMIPVSAQTADCWILSLDCDGLESSLMEAVSAVNHKGLPPLVVAEILQWYQHKVQSFQPPVVGVYEYNPLYDNTSAKGARFLAGLLYPFLQ